MAWRFKKLPVTYLLDRRASLGEAGGEGELGPEGHKYEQRNHKKTWQTSSHERPLLTRIGEFSDTSFRMGVSSTSGLSSLAGAP